MRVRVLAGEQLCQCASARSVSDYRDFNGLKREGSDYAEPSLEGPVG